MAKLSELESNTMEDVTSSISTLTIRIRDTDSQLLLQIADADDRTPAEQAASFVHKALVMERARANEPDKPQGFARRGPRTAAA